METISGIVEATAELQNQYQGLGVIVNPPVSVQERDLYEENNAGHTYRRVETVHFDVAVSATSESGGGGKAGLKILSVEAGLDGKHARRSEEASRVKFSIPMTLPPSAAETKNKQILDQDTAASSGSYDFDARDDL
ncbi:hypothetical protein KX928_18045 [Roseobacter sp. YSTF-M11]|uniref:Uncharacterized protein n=1 Tax=Roseobacter insulae TaxID=2859783 RepID=A0A9X1K3M0_9RHOB|nr:hypothetical protein [Roseobacter insulae]